MLWITDLEKNEIGPNMKWEKLIDTFDAEHDMLVYAVSSFAVAGTHVFGQSR